MTERKIETYEALVGYVDEIKEVYPHVAVISQNDQFKSRFFNVYFRTEVEQALSIINLSPVHCYAILGTLVTEMYTVKVVPPNDFGFATCTISIKDLGKNAYTNVISGTAGKPHDAIVSAFVKHRLVLSSEGYWFGDSKPNKLDKRFS